MKRPATCRRDRFNLVAALAALLPALVLAVAMLGCGRAQAQTGAFQPVTGYTDCGIDGGLVAMNPTVQYSPLHPETELARWGPCSGRAGGGCDDNKLNTWGERRCITTESEASVTREALRWEYSGSCTPPRDTPYPDPQLIEDYGKVVGAFGGRRGLRARWEAACFARPTPAPTAGPLPTAAPVEPRPTPTIAPTPSPVQIPPSPPTDANCRAVGCPPVPQATPTVTPTPACKVCDRYEAMPARHRETYLAAPYWKRPLTRAQQQRLNEANAWTRAHESKWYVPNSNRSSANITQSIGEWDCEASIGGWVCSDEEMLIPHFVRYPAEQEVIALRGGM